MFSICLLVDIKNFPNFRHDLFDYLMLLILTKLKTDLCSDIIMTALCKRYAVSSGSDKSTKIPSACVAVKCCNAFMCVYQYSGVV